LPSLREKLRVLEELQQIDLDAHAARQGLDAIPAQRATVEARVKAARKAYDDQKARLEANERERRQVDTLLGMDRDKVKKWEGRLGEIKTPREYAAMSREIDIAKKSNETQSEQAKVLAAAAVEIRIALEDGGEALAEVEDAAQAATAKLDQATTEAEAKLASLAARRAVAATLVEASLLAKYENIRRRRAGVAVAAVVGSTCKGCQRNIPPQLSIVLQRVNTIETCPNCHRIIYSHDAVNPPAPPPPA
jgi:predicted  nucleic acid-binding Zn-ribbon protein